MKNFSNQSGTDYVSLLKYELNEIGLLSQDPSLKSYQKDVEQSLLEEEFDIRFSPDKDIQKKLSKLDKKGLERRYQTRMLTLEEYRNGMELAKEMDEVIVPESHRQHGGMASSLPDFLKDENAIFGLTGEFPTPTKINWKGIAEAAMVVSAAVAGGIVLDKYKNDKKFSNAVDDGIAKAKAQIFGAAPVIVPPLAEKIVNASATPAPTFDYFDQNLKVGIKIKKYNEYPLFPKNVTNMLYIMKNETPKKYEEAMNAFKQTPKEIVKSSIESDAKYSWNSEKMIGLADEIEQWGGSDNIREVLRANGPLYAEMMASEPPEKPLKNRYETELRQHSNIAKYEVDAGIIKKEAANQWLKGGEWFNVVEGRFPTPEDKKGVDIEKYLIN